MQEIPDKREGDSGGHQQRTEAEAASARGFPKISGQALRGGSAKLKDWWTWSGSNRRPLPCHGSKVTSRTLILKGLTTGGVAKNRPKRRNLLPNCYQKLL